VSYHAIRLLAQAPQTEADGSGNADAAMALYVALVGGALCDIHRDRRLKSRGPAPRTLGLDPERIAGWFSGAAGNDGAAPFATRETAGWLLGQLDAILRHYAASDIVFVAAGGDCRDAADEILESLAEQHAVECIRRGEQHWIAGTQAAADHNALYA
jgi:hypothetical protein